MVWFLILPLACVAIVALTYRVVRRVDRDPIAAMAISSIVAMLMLVLCPFAIIFAVKATSGFYSDYAEGQRTGYVTKLSRKGLYWKTWEGEIQLSTGEAASLQPGFEFSVVKPEIVDELHRVIGTDQRVKLHYREWAMMPWWIGDSGYEIVKIETLE